MKDLPDKNYVVQQLSSEPCAFALGAISSQHFSSIDDSNNVLADKNYKWDFITEQNTVIDNQRTNIQSEESKDESKKLPTMEEIMQRRANEIL
jgi:hypothetical protein